MSEGKEKGFRVPITHTHTVIASPCSYFLSMPHHYFAKAELQEEYGHGNVYDMEGKREHRLTSKY